MSRCFDHPRPPKFNSHQLLALNCETSYQRSPSNLEYLKQFITEEIHAIHADELQRRYENVLLRLTDMKRHEGSHFEHS